MTTLQQNTMANPNSELLAHLHTGACNPATQAFYEAQLLEVSQRVASGDMSDMEAILSNQVTSLNDMYTRFMISADSFRYEGEVDTAERYCKSALQCADKAMKAIKQLSAMKKPKRGSIYIRTMNQQINSSV